MLQKVIEIGLKVKQKIQSLKRIQSCYNVMIFLLFYNIVLGFAKTLYNL